MLIEEKRKIASRRENTESRDTSDTRGEREDASCTVDPISGSIDASDDRWSVVICRAYRVYVYAHMCRHMLITHAPIDIKNSCPHSRLSQPRWRSAALYSGRKNKSGILRIVTRRDRVHEISRKDREGDARERDEEVRQVGGFKRYRDEAEVG